MESSAGAVWSSDHMRMQKNRIRFELLQLDRMQPPDRMLCILLKNYERNVRITNIWFTLTLNSISVNGAVE